MPDLNGIGLVRREAALEALDVANRAERRRRRRLARAKDRTGGDERHPSPRPALLSRPKGEFQILAWHRGYPSLHRPGGGPNRPLTPSRAPKIRARVSEKIARRVFNVIFLRRTTPNARRPAASADASACAEPHDAVRRP
jgi:hypothetical protein